MRGVSIAYLLDCGKYQYHRQPCVDNIFKKIKEILYEKKPKKADGGPAGVWVVSRNAANIKKLHCLFKNFSRFLTGKIVVLVEQSFGTSFIDQNGEQAFFAGEYVFNVQRRG